jgi:single-stranded-DNA-specific exonuclease
MKELKHKKWQKTGDYDSLLDVIESKSGESAERLLDPPRVELTKIRGLQESAYLIKTTIANGSKITIVGDYDADGITGSAILYRLLKHKGANDFSVRLPRRHSEGYGLSMNIVDEISDGLVVTVDNGITAVEQIRVLKEKGVDVIIIDHHIPLDVLPDADMIINPHIDPTDSDKNSWRFYCGAGLAYKLAEYMLDINDRADKEVLYTLTVIAAIGTVADVMPLLGDNRRIVMNGFQIARSRPRMPLGVQILADMCNIEALNEGDVGYTIGPMLNAGGRLEDTGAELGFQLLTTGNPTEAKALIDVMTLVNERRKKLTTEWHEKCTEIVKAGDLNKVCPLCVYTDGMPEGIAGLIAGRLAEEYKMPAIVIATSTKSPDIIKGSGRTYGDINLRELLRPLDDKMLTIGGHAQALGLSMSRDYYVGDFKDDLAELNPGFVPQDDVELYDIEIKAEELDDALITLKKYAPYGEGNPMPVVKVLNATLTPRYGSHFKYLGAEETHLKLFGNNYDIVAFGKAQQYTEIGQPMVVDIVGEVNENVFRGKSTTQILANDFKASGTFRRESPLASKLAGLSAVI